MIFTGPTLDHVWLDALRALLEAPEIAPRGDASQELCGVTLEIAEPIEGHFNGLLRNPVRGMSQRYAAGEMLWYLSGSDKLDFISHYAPSYGRFSDDGVRLYGAYGERMFHQLRAVIQSLVIDPSTRQAVVSLWHLNDAHVASQGQTKDLPCTLNLQFLIRDGQLNMIVNMRSNDIWLGTVYDVYCFKMLQTMIAMHFDIPVGWYKHNVGSLHLYARNKKKALRAAEDKDGLGLALMFSPQFRYEGPMDFFAARTAACFTEERLRESGGGQLLNEGDLAGTPYGFLLSEIV